MDDRTGDALTDVLSRSASRRQALRLAAGSTLGGLLALSVSPAAAVTERPALPKNWTHLAATTGAILFYQRGTGRGASGTLVDGFYTRAAAYTDFTADFTQIIGAGRSLYLRRASDGLAASGYLDAGGRWVFVAVEQFFPGDRLLPGTRGGYFGFYDGQYLYPTVLTSAGARDRETAIVGSNVGPNWTLLAGAGFNTFLLYGGETGVAATGRMEKATPSGSPSYYRWVPRKTYEVGTGWTHIVGTFNGGILFYNRQTGTGATGYLDAFGNFTPHASNPTFGPGWTHVAGAGGRGVLFYNASTGKGVGGFLNAAGAWTPTTTYG